MVALVADLFFADRIIEIGKTVDEAVTICHTSREFQSLVNREPPSLAVVDLSLLNEDDLTWVAKIPHVAGFGPHVDHNRFQMARNLGIRDLWANSAMARKLGPWILASRDLPSP